VSDTGTGRRTGGWLRRIGGGIARLLWRLRYVGVVLVALAAVLYVVKDRLLFAPVDGFTLHEPGPEYEALVPYYVELCAVSQFRSEKMGRGGSPGHAVMYLKGACRDREAPYPRLRRCPANLSDPNDPDHGVGISVNRWFRTANWVAFEGRGQFFGAQPADGQPVTYERLEEVARAARDAGVFRGIGLWPNPSQAEVADRIEFIIRHSAGTDFALRYARSGLCGRVPIEGEMMEEIIHFLNDLNRKFATGAIDYVWNAYHDNCVHTLRNALAAASIDEPISVRATKLRQLFHLAIPANEAIHLAALGTKGPLESFPDIFASDPMRNALLEFGWLPTRHGSVLVSLPVYANNEIFDPNPRLLVFQGPLTLRTTYQLLKMLDEPRFTELGPNLAHFAGIYRDILARRDEQDVVQAVRGDRYRRARRRYFEVVGRMLEDAERMQAALPSAK